MLSSLKDLQSYVLHDLDETADIIFKRPCMMTSPGCSPEELEKLKEALPGIPESYIKAVKAYNFNGIAIGYFEVSPWSFKPEGMVANLIEGYKADDHKEYAKKYNLYLIATRPDYGIYVATAESPFQEGEIILMDLEIFGEQDNLERWIFRLAKDFEQFLIVAGNLNQIHREIKKDDSNRDEKKKEFFNRLRILGVSEEYYPAWESVF